MSNARVIDRLFFLALQSKLSPLAIWVVGVLLIGAMAGAASADPLFSAARSFELVGGAMRVAMADVNGDGKSDLVAANFTGNTVSVLLGNGDGTFQAGVDYGTGNAPNFVMIRVGKRLAGADAGSEVELVQRKSRINTASCVFFPNAKTT